MVSHNGENKIKQKNPTQPQLRVVPTDPCEVLVSSQLLVSGALCAGALLTDRTPPLCWTTAERFFFIQGDVAEVCLHVLWEYFTSVSANN